MAKRHLKSREGSRTNHEVHGDGRGGGIEGDYTISPKFAKDTMLVLPKADERTIFRPWGELDPQRPNDHILPGRTGIEARQYSNWFISVPCASYIGGPNDVKHTFCCYPPYADKKDPIRAENPWQIFFNVAADACDSGSFSPNVHWEGQWNPLMKGSRQKGACITPPASLCFVQGHLYQRGMKYYVDNTGRKPYGLGEDDLLPIIRFKFSKPSDKGSAGGMCGLQKLLGKPSKASESGALDPETDSIDSFFMYRDPIGHMDEKTGEIKGGLLLELFNPKKIEPMDIKHCSWDGKPNDYMPFHFGVHYAPTINGVKCPAGMSAEDVKRIFEKANFWEPDDEGNPGLINFITCEEQCVLIARSFASFPKLVRLCWGDYPSFLSREVEAVLNDAVSASVPGDVSDLENPARGPHKPRSSQPAAPTQPADDPDDQMPDSEGGEAAEASKETRDPSVGTFDQSRVPPPQGRGAPAKQTQAPAQPVDDDDAMPDEELVSVPFDTDADDDVMPGEPDPELQTDGSEYRPQRGRGPEGAADTAEDDNMDAQSGDTDDDNAPGPDPKPGKNSGKTSKDVGGTSTTNYKQGEEKANGATSAPNGKATGSEEKKPAAKTKPAGGTESTGTPPTQSAAKPAAPTGAAPPAATDAKARRTATHAAAQQAINASGRRSNPDPTQPAK